jgi:uncharacterized protein
MLAELFGSKLRAKVLGWLFAHPDERYFVRQLTTLLHEDSTNVSRELARLQKLGILVLTTEGHQKYYQVNAKNPVYDELHGLVLKTEGIANVIRSALEPVRHKIRAAFIFGSMAARSENRESDIDIIVVGQASFSEVVSLISPAQETLGREINPVVYPVMEYRQKIKEDHYFLKTVLEGEKIFIIGDERELAGLGRKRKIKTT